MVGKGASTYLDEWRGPGPRFISEVAPSRRRLIGYEKAKAKLRCIESEESLVAFGPPA